MTDANGNRSEYRYDSIGRLASQAHAFDGGVGNLAFTFGYNPASQIVTRTRSNDAYVAPAPAATDAYTADSLNRIAAVDGAAFGYDANGNLTSQPASVTGAAARTFSYDVENRLVGSGDGVVLHYDPLGRLYQISGGPTTRRLVWDGDALIAEYNQVNTLMERYAHGGAAGVDDPLIWNRSGAYRRLHPDHQGSIVAITDGAGANYAINRYDEWGVPVEPLVGRFGYTGQIWIPELGLWHYKARMYAPYLGRFMQVDPVGYEGGMNLYGYIENDPPNFADPNGESCDTGSRLGEAAQCRVEMDYFSTETSAFGVPPRAPHGPRSYGGGGNDSGQQVPGGELTEAHIRCRSCHGIGSENRRYSTEAENDALIDIVSLIPAVRISQIPRRVFRVANIVQRTGAAPRGFAGGRAYRNREGRLPRRGNYREFDIDPRPTVGPRNAERIVIDTRTGRRWYISDHYRTFIDF